MRVLCTCLPGFGHFNPLVPLARALTRAGHDVAFATAAGFCPRVEQAGFTAFPAGMDLAAQLKAAAERYPDLASLPMGKERFETFVPRMLAGVAAPARAQDLVPLVDSWAPDVILHDEAEFAAPVAAAVAGIPYASQSIVQLRPWGMTLLAGRELAPVAERWGVHVGSHGGLYRYLHFDSCPPSLQAPHIDEVPVAHPLRNTDDLDTAAGDALPPWVEQLPERATVYVTLGTVFNRNPAVLGAILAGLGGMGVNVVATVGHGHDPVRLGDQPESVHVARYIPLSLLLPYLDVVVTQGGTSILPALGHGLPLLVLPQGADQFHNAEACVAAGVGRRLLPDEVEPAAVRGEVDVLLRDPSFSRHARLVQGEIDAMPGPEAGVELLERLVRERGPITR